MAFIGLNKGARRFGLSTHAFATRIMPQDVRDAELEYLSMRQAFGEMVNRLEQARECLSQAKADGDADLEKYAGDLIHSVNSSLVDYRRRVREMGEKAWAEAFYFCADHMLSKEAKMHIGQEADRLIGRQRHELKPRNERGTTP